MKPNLAAIVSLGTLLIAGIGPVASGGILTPALVDMPCTPDEDYWTIPSGVSITCTDTTITLTHIEVDALAELTLTNVNLVFDPDVDADGHQLSSQIRIQGNDYGRIPEYGGTVNLHNTTITSNDPTKKHGGIRIWGGGTLIMHDSEIRDAYDGVITVTEIENVEVKRSIISTHRAAFALHDSMNVLIEDNLLTGPGDGVFIWQDPTGIIRNNTITQCSTGIYFYGNGANAQEISGNTITACQGGITSNHCEHREYHGNDVFRNYGRPSANFGTTWRYLTSDTSVCGDVTGNWWGEQGPTADRFKRPVDYTPWLTEPVHPERLPSIEINVPDTVQAGQRFHLSAEALPSQTWKAPITDITWTIDGREIQGTTHAIHKPGTHTITALATDDLALSRTAIHEIYVEPRQ